MKSQLAALITGILFLTVGVVCLLWPERIQEYGLKYHAARSFALDMNPFLSWMKTQSYVWTLRVVGLVSVTVFVFSVWLIMKDR